jgi:hypothetical protein
MTPSPAQQPQREETYQISMRQILSIEKSLHGDSYGLQVLKDIIDSGCTIPAAEPPQREYIINAPEQIRSQAKALSDIITLEPNTAKELTHIEGELWDIANKMESPIQQEYYLLIRDDMEEFYDSLVHVVGKEYADTVWTCIENRTHPHPPAPEGYTGEDVFGPFIHEHNKKITRAATLAERDRMHISEMIRAEKDNQLFAVITDEEALNIAYLRWRGAYNDHVFIPSQSLRTQSTIAAQESNNSKGGMRR